MMLAVAAVLATSPAAAHAAQKFGASSGTHGVSQDAAGPAVEPRARTHKTPRENAGSALLLRKPAKRTSLPVVAQWDDVKVERKDDGSASEDGGLAVHEQPIDAKERNAPDDVAHWIDAQAKLKPDDGVRDVEEAEAEAEAILAVHEQPTPVSDAVALMLLGMVAFQIGLFYLVNYPDEDVRQFTWLSVSHTITIYCAVTLWNVIKTSVEFMIGEQDDALGVGIPWATEANLIVLFGAIFVLSQWVKSTMWRNPVCVSAFGALAAETLGFSAVDAFGEIMQMEPWRDSVAALLAGTAIIGVSFYCLLVLCTRFRKSRCEKCIETDKDQELIAEYMETCAENENEFAGFVLGLLLTQAMIFTITGTMPPIEGFPFGKTMQDVRSLLAGAVGFSIALMIFIVFVRKVYKDNHSPATARAIEVTEMTISMAVGWTLLFAGRWFFWVSTADHGVGQGDLMSARMVQALAFSFACFASIFVFDYLADNDYLDAAALRSLMSAIGLLLGLAWEGAFREAIESVGRMYDDTPTRKIENVDMVSVLLCAVVLPAWVMYIHPVAMAAEKGAKKTQQLKIASRTVAAESEGGPENVQVVES